MTEVSFEAKRLLGALGIKIEQEDAAYGAAVAEFITDYCRGHSDPTLWSADLRLLARFSTDIFQRGYQARRSQELGGISNVLKKSLLEAARGFQMMADNPAQDATPEWLVECRKNVAVLTSSAEALESFAGTSGLPASEVEN